MSSTILDNINYITQEWDEIGEREDCTSINPDCGFECCVCGDQESTSRKSCPNQECLGDFCRACQATFMVSQSLSALYAVLPARCCKCLTQMPMKCWENAIGSYEISAQQLKDCKKMAREQEVPAIAADFLFRRQEKNSFALLSLRCGGCHGSSNLSIESNFSQLSPNRRVEIVQNIFSLRTSSMTHPREIQPHETLKITSAWKNMLNYHMSGDRFVEEVVNVFKNSIEDLLDGNNPERASILQQLDGPTAPKPLLELLKGIVIATFDVERRTSLQVAILNRFPFTTTPCCNAPHCFRCQSKGHHNGVSCDSIQRAQMDSTVQFCPSCRVATVKTEGCSHVICVCGENWTWEDELDPDITCVACRGDLQRYCPLNEGCLHVQNRQQRLQRAEAAMPSELKEIWTRAPVPEIRRDVTKSQFLRKSHKEGEEAGPGPGASGRGSQRLAELEQKWTSGKFPGAFSSTASGRYSASASASATASEEWNGKWGRGQLVAREVSVVLGGGASGVRSIAELSQYHDSGESMHSLRWNRFDFGTRSGDINDCKEVGEVGGTFIGKPGSETMDVMAIKTEALGDRRQVESSPVWHRASIGKQGSDAMNMMDITTEALGHQRQVESPTVWDRMRKQTGLTLSELHAQQMSRDARKYKIHMPSHRLSSRIDQQAMSPRVYRSPLLDMGDNRTSAAPVADLDISS